MSSLEEKAKTTAEIYYGYDTCDYYNFYATQKWVKLEEAQKLEEKLEDSGRLYGLLLGKYEELGKANSGHLRIIEKVNKILDETMKELCAKRFVGCEFKIIEAKKILSQELIAPKETKK